MIPYDFVWLDTMPFTSGWPTGSSSSSPTLRILLGLSVCKKRRSTWCFLVRHGVSCTLWARAEGPGGPDYLKPSDSDNEPVSYSLSSILPIHGKDLFDISAKITPNIAYFLPRNVDLNELGELAPLVPSEGTKVPTREWVEIEEERMGPKVKAVTAYFGGLAGAHQITI